MALSFKDVCEYWIKALGVSDITGIRAALPRLLIEDEGPLSSEHPSIGNFERGKEFHQLLFDDKFASQSKDVCFCYCVPSNAIATNLTRWEKKDSEEEASADGRKRLADIIEATKIVYLIPASICKDGAIVPRQNGIPIIVRHHLEPAVVDERSQNPKNTAAAAPPPHLQRAEDDEKDLVIGDYAKFLKGVSELFGCGSKGLSSMPDYWSAAQELFREVSGCAPGALELRLLLTEAQNRFAATRCINHIYQSCPTKLEDIPLVAQLLQPRIQQESSLLPPRLAAAARSQHFAMVDRVKAGERQLFPLDRSQRLALHNVIALRNEPRIIAVSGPPGTGKTDMLRAIVANRWVTAAYNEELCPPFTIVCGATNQSVHNVMDAFSGAEINEDKLKARWIKGISGYTSIFPAQSRLERDGETYQTVEKAWLKRENGKKRPEVRFSGKASVVGTQGRRDLPRLAEHYLSEFKIAFPQYAPALQSRTSACSVDDAVYLLETVRKLLRQELCDQVQHIDEARQYLLDQLSSLSKQELKKWISAQGENPDETGCKSAIDRFLDSAQAADPGEHQDAIESLLDVTLRWRCFHIAARYWEARWLAGLPERESTGAMANNQRNQKEQLQEQLHRLAMLTPCVVSTLHSAPRMFLFYKDGEKDVPDWGFADLLVVDEAGQAAPEIGGAMFALANQALVVGDLKQLMPVTQMTPPMEESIAAVCKVDLVSLQNTSLDSRTGSVMAMAMRASARSDPGVKSGGIRLRNHYRCAPTIIGYCIALMYRDRDEVGDELVPKRTNPRPVGWDEPVEDGYPLPPMAFVQSGSPDDEPENKGGSKLNRGEAVKIADWLAEYGPKLLAWQRAVNAVKSRRAGQLSGQEETALSQLVAIVTPFRAQVKEIKELLIKRFGSHPDPALCGIKKLTVGTVHILQGAEFPVVLFSAVNRESVAQSRDDKPEDQVFIDRDGGNLLNVAVSRAQRSFILFGHSDLFFAPSSLVRENDLPSALLGRYLSGLHDRGQIGVKIGPKALVIVESAAKARIINEVLGSDYSVFGTGGHIRELADLDLNKAVLYPARLRLTPLILAIPGVNSYRLRLEAAETIERGFLKADPGAQAELLHDRVTWEQAQRVRAGPF